MGLIKKLRFQRMMRIQVALKVETFLTIIKKFDGVMICRYMKIFIAYGGWNHTCSDHKLTEQTETIMAYFPGAIRKDWIVDQKAHDEQVVIGYQCSCGDIHEVENN